MYFQIAKALINSKYRVTQTNLSGLRDINTLEIINNFPSTSGNRSKSVQRFFIVLSLKTALFVYNLWY